MFFLFSTIFGVFASKCSIAWFYIAWLPLTFTVIGQNNLMNIYYKSEILSSRYGSFSRVTSF